MSRRSTGRRPARYSVDEARDVAAGHARAEVGAAQRALLGDEADRRDLEHLVRVRQADGDGRAAAPGRRVGLGEHAPRCRPSRSPGRRRRRSPRGPPRPRRRPASTAASRRARGASSSFASTTSTATIVPAPATPRAEQRREADAAEAEDRDALARLDVRAVDDRADPGQHRAAEQRRDLERQRRVDLHRRARRDDDVVGERGHAEVVVEWRARGAAQPRARR